jgi:ribonuclease J
MSLEIIPVGGYSEIGRNCTILKVDDEAVVLDMGLHMDNYISYQEILENTPNKRMSVKELRRVGAIPNLKEVKDLIPKVKGIFATHAHLDHIGAIPFLASKFNCDIHASKFTIEVLRTLAKENKNFKNKLVAHKLNSTFKLSKKIKIEFINMTHSTPHTTMIVVHTPYGSVCYANDFKLDKDPVLGNKPDLKIFKRLGRKGVKALIIDSLYAKKDEKTPSESKVKEMIKNLIFENDFSGKALIITTFASHIARLKTIVEAGRSLKREVVFIGRSFDKYVTAAKDAGIIDLTQGATLIKYSSQVRRFLKKMTDPSKYLLIVTGHQGEARSILPRMVYKELFDFQEGDNVIFSCSVIPVPTNIENREKLDYELKRKKVKIFTDIHVSGHASRKDHEQLIDLLRPEIIIPSHAEKETLQEIEKLAISMGYDKDKVLIMGNYERRKL